MTKHETTTTETYPTRKRTAEERAAEAELKAKTIRETAAIRAARATDDLARDCGRLVPMLRNAIAEIEDRNLATDDGMAALQDAMTTLQNVVRRIAKLPV